MDPEPSWHIFQPEAQTHSNNLGFLIINWHFVEKAAPEISLEA